VGVCTVLFLLFRGFFVSRSNLILENLALRQQLTVQQRTIKRPKLKRKDRIFWAWLSRIWPQWKSALIVVKPGIVIKWHRRGFKLYWRWKSRPSKVGRPRISKEIRDRIRQMSQENPTWGAPRIQSELKLLGFEIADSTVPKYLIRDRDGIYGNFFQQRMKNMGIREVLIAPKSPWQNPYCERVIGSIRRECLDHCIFLSEDHLCRILKDYMDYYNNCRTHLSLDRNSPSLRDIEPLSKGKVISIPQAGGLHHVYKRVA